jgi:2-polyprenyl-3-methyl-5-hydroxy-6-metoxy-1,4-benzoquinol methylase
MWDNRYADKEYAYGKKENDFLRESFEYLPKDTHVLSLAEGEGRNAVFLSKKGFDVHAIDSSIEGIKKAKLLAAENEVSFSYDQVKLEDFDFKPDSFGAIISIFAHTSKKIQSELFIEIKKALKPGGVFLLEGYNSKQLVNGTGGPKSLEMMFDIESLKIDFRDFEILLAHNTSREINEGIYHNGNSEVVQFICKRPLV